MVGAARSEHREMTEIETTERETTEIETTERETTEIETTEIDHVIDSVETDRAPSKGCA
jgi:hypothetical protein